MSVKRIISVMLAAVMLMSSSVTAMADREDAVLDKPYVSLGADLTAAEKSTVLELLGIKESDLANYTVVQITNAMEHQYLDAYMDSSLIGSRALSSVLVKGKNDGSGIKVTTKNISYCTVGMYQNALATAGLKDAEITVVGPFKISGTAGLVGAIKSYENMTGHAVSEENVKTATEELVVTSELGDTIGDSQKAEELVGFIKNEVSSKEYTEAEIRSLIDSAASEMNISLSEEDKAKILELMDKIDDLDLDVSQLQEQVEGLYDRLQNLDLDLHLDSEETRNFLSDLFQKIVDFFHSLLG